MCGRWGVPFVSLQPIGARQAAERVANGNARKRAHTHARTHQRMLARTHTHTGTLTHSHAHRLQATRPVTTRPSRNISRSARRGPKPLLSPGLRSACVCVCFGVSPRFVCLFVRPAACLFVCLSGQPSLGSVCLCVCLWTAVHRRVPPREDRRAQVAAAAARAPIDSRAAAAPI